MGWSSSHLSYVGPWLGKLCPITGERESSGRGGHQGKAAQGLKLEVTLTVTSLSQRSGNSCEKIQLHVPHPVSLDLHVVSLCSSMLLRGLVAWIPVCQEGFSMPLGCHLPTFIQSCMEVGNQLGVPPKEKWVSLKGKKMREELSSEFGFMNQNDSESHWVF